TIEWKKSLSVFHEIMETISAFSNTEGGKILVGVSDDGEVLGVQLGKGTIEDLVNKIGQHTDPKVFPKISVKRVGGKDVIVIDVKESRDHLVLADGLPYKRVGRTSPRMSKDEYERLILEKHKDKLHFDELICKKATIADISREKLLTFVRKAKEQRGLSIASGASVMDILKKLKLIKDGKLTNAAILLFGTDTNEFFLQAELKLIRFKGVDVTRPMLDFKTIGGDAITLLEKAESFIFDHIPMRAWIESGKLQRQEKWLYPEEAIREALANALAHRNYASPSNVQVRIFDDRLEVWNPGLLPPSLTVEKLKGDHDSIPRNPLIAKAFFWIKFAEDVGSGTSKIIQWCKEWGLSEPTYKEAGGSFVTVFHGPQLPKGQETGSEKSSEKGSEKSSEKIMAVIREHPAASAQQIADIVGLSARAVEKHLSNLKVKGVLKRVGPDKGGRWELQGGA
ncbi:MAG: ATP-binding protein, partial [Lentisphaerota bacterium]